MRLQIKQFYSPNIAALKKSKMLDRLLNAARFGCTYFNM